MIRRSLVMLSATMLCLLGASADEKLEGIACRSVHLQYPAPEGTAFYNEVTVDQSAPGTYFCVCGFNMGYFGIQELGDGKKVVLFSIWDPGNQNDPNAVKDEQRVKLLYNDEAVRVKRFGNEGTGGQSFFDYDWKVGETYRFLVTARAEGDRTAFSGFMYIPEEKQWKRLVTFATLAGGANLRGYYSFVEDFRRNRVSATQARRAHYGNGWVRTRDGQWAALARARFTADRNPVMSIDAGVDGERFFLATGGDTKNEHTPLNESMNRPASAAEPPRDLDELIKSDRSKPVIEKTEKAGAANQDEVAVRIEGARASIGNRLMQWNYSLEGKKLASISIENRVAKKTDPIEGGEFVLELADGSQIAANEFSVDRAFEQAADRGGKALVVEMSRGETRVRAITEMRPNEWWATRRLEVEAGAAELAAVKLAHWRAEGARGPSGPGAVVNALGFPSGCGQPVFTNDLFFGIAHPGAENFVRDGFIQCRLPVYRAPNEKGPIVTREMIVGVGENGDARRAFLRYIDATRPVPARMIFLVNDWYWKDKSKPVEAIEALARVKKETGVPVDSFTLDDGWDFDWDEQTGLWGRLSRTRFPGGWDALEAAGRDAGIGVSLWFGPIGGYQWRDKRVAYGRERGFEVYGDKLCLAGDDYRKHVIESFSNWAKRGMDYIKVDGFWPECKEADHGHPPAPGGAVARMDRLIEVFDAWHVARPNLVIGYTSGSNPSPFWLRHCDYVWRGGADDAHEGPGEPFEKHNTFLDGCLHDLRNTEMPISGIVTFDLVQHRIAGNSAAGFDRGAWWLAARTSLHHDWYVQASDLTTEQWRVMAKVSEWAKGHEREFRFSRMIGGNPRAGEIYGFAAFDEKSGTLAFRNPSEQPRSLKGTLADWLDLPDAMRTRSLAVRAAYGETKSLEGTHAANDTIEIALPPFAIAVMEVESSAK